MILKKIYRIGENDRSERVINFSFELYENFSLFDCFVVIFDQLAVKVNFSKVHEKID